MPATQRLRYSQLTIVILGLGSGPKTKSLCCFCHHSYSAGNLCSLHKRGDWYRIKMRESFTGQRKTPSCPHPSSIQPGEAAPCCASRDPAGWQPGTVLKKAAGNGSREDKGTLRHTAPKATTASRENAGTESGNGSIQGSSPVVSHSDLLGSDFQNTRSPRSQPPGAYLYVLAQPFERGRLAARPVRCDLFPAHVLHHNDFFQRGAPVKGKEPSAQAAQAKPAPRGFYGLH